MKLKYSLAITLAVIVSHSSLRAQPFDSLLNKLNEQFPQEKIYLHFDKTLYNPGETIWFKAYLFTGTFPSEVSKTIYMELVDPKGNVLQRKSAPVIMSSAAAAFDIPADFKIPTVYIRAYTKWMLSFDSSFLFEKAVPITVSKPSVPRKSSPVPAAFLQFFPEGGDLVTGLESRIAFKTTDRRGMPVTVKGDVVDSKSKKVTSFSSVHDGMGFFSLEPAAGETYKAIWKDPAAVAHETILPKPLAGGAVLELSQTPDYIRFLIKRSTEAGESYSNLYVVAQMQQQLLYRAKANLVATTMTSGVIPTKGLPAGIVQVTLFTADYRPVAERIIFVNHQDYYFITDLNSALKDMGRKKKNVIQIDVPDTVPCNLSVSVTDADLNKEPDEGEDIYSHLLLASDIKGYVHDPAYYFASDADSVASNLDLVMMTNGWRRFKWEDLLAGRWPRTNKEEEDFITVNGSVLGLTRSEMSQKELNGIFTLKSGSQQFLTVPLGGDGQFRMHGLLFYDTAKIYYQLNNDKGKVLTSRASFNFRSDLQMPTPSILPDSMMAVRLSRADTTIVSKNRQLTQKQLALLDDQARNVKTLSNITVIGHKKSKQEEMNELYTSPLFRNDDGFSFITEDDPLASTAIDVLSYLQGKVPGLQITGSGAQRQVTWRGGAPSMFLNEMQGGVDLIQSTPMSDVAMIKVFRPPFFGASGGGANGAIAVYTKKGKALNDNIKGLDFVKVAGYSPPKEFYSPDYSIYNQANDQPDYRTTLYWNPFVFTGKDRRRIFLTFYNNDFTKKMRVVVEGVNADGKLTKMEKIFE
jgi:hypothetical protein